MPSKKSRRKSGVSRSRRYSPVESAYYRQKVWSYVNKAKPRPLKKLYVIQRNIRAKISIKARIRQYLRAQSHRLEDTLKKRRSSRAEILKKTWIVRPPLVAASLPLARGFEPDRCSRTRERVRRAYFGYLKSSPHGKAGTPDKRNKRFDIPKQCRRK